MLKTCIILAAGLGTRMRPLTNECPKPMIQVLNKPLIAYVIDMCLEAGIQEIIMNFHYKPETLKMYIQNNYAKNVILSDEQDLLLDSGGGVLKALMHTDSSEFFVINADCIWYNQTDNALKQLYTIYNPLKFDICKLLINPKNAIAFDGKPIYNLDNDFYIYKDSDLNYEFTGIQIIKRTLFDGYTLKPFSIRDIWQTVFDNHRMGGIEFKGKWLHIGTPQAVNDAENYLNKLGI
jgi:N-acetyl-alpha-D-muramate 1-phosphate uridylyltransferase